MFGKKKAAIDELSERLDRAAYILDAIVKSYDFSAAASLLSTIAEMSRYYKDEIPTTEEKVAKYLQIAIDGVYRRCIKGQKNVFDGAEDKDIKEKFYPLIKIWFEKEDDKTVIKSRGEMGEARMNPFLAELYGITPDSKIILSSPDSPVHIDAEVKIDPELKPLLLGLHLNDANPLFGWLDKVPDEFEKNSYRGKYRIEGVVPPKPTTPTVPETSLERMEKILGKTHEELTQKP
jgi:hypothetical protein